MQKKQMAYYNLLAKYVMYFFFVCVFFYLLNSFLYHLSLLYFYISHSHSLLYREIDFSFKYTCRNNSFMDKNYLISLFQTLLLLNIQEISSHLLIYVYITRFCTNPFYLLFRNFPAVTPFFISTTSPI